MAFHRKKSRQRLNTVKSESEYKKAKTLQVCNEKSGEIQC